ncbi:MAG: 50S ribosomal protein L29 [Candidatus Omnitrophota bacterium]
MKAKEVRELPKEELEQKILTLKEELFHLRYQSKTGRLEKPSRIRAVKRDIARINTIIRESKNANTQNTKN